MDHIRKFQEFYELTPNKGHFYDLFEVPTVYDISYISKKAALVQDESVSYPVFYLYNRFFNKSAKLKPPLHEKLKSTFCMKMVAENYLLNQAIQPKIRN